MLLDTVSGLRSLYDKFVCFLLSATTTCEFPAETNGSPAPYEKFLDGLRVKKCSDKSQTRIIDNWVELAGSDVELAQFKERLLIKNDGDHTHWYASPVSLIIEADSWDDED